jgi:hypothetical protein
MPDYNPRRPINRRTKGNQKMTRQMTRLLIKLHAALRTELGLNAQMSLLIKEPIYREEFLSRAELLGTDEIRRLANQIRRMAHCAPNAGAA